MMIDMYLSREHMMKVLNHKKVTLKVYNYMRDIKGSFKSFLITNYAYSNNSLIKKHI